MRLFTAKNRYDLMMKKHYIINTNIHMHTHRMSFMNAEPYASMTLVSLI